MSFDIGTFTLAAGQEFTFIYYWGPSEAPYYVGPKVLNPGPSLPPGGSVVATGQGIRNIGVGVDQRIQYLVTLRNLSGFGITFSCRGGDLT